MTTMQRRRALLAATAASLASAGCALAPRRGASAAAAVRLREFVAPVPSTPQSHASTLVETTNGALLAAWFGGTAERAPDVRIWLARRDGSGNAPWNVPCPVADGAQPDGTRLPTWNPVLFQLRNGPLLLFYKVGPDPTRWWGELMRSYDDGRQWSAPVRLPVGVLGPIRSKPLQLPDGTLLSPSSTEAADGTWRIHFERSADRGTTWQRGDDVAAPASLAAIQPSLALCPDGRVLAFARTRADCIASTESRDGGISWSVLTPTVLPNPNAGVEALALADGRLLMVSNPRRAGRDWWEGRDRLDVTLSCDGGRNWTRAATLEDVPGQEFSYPAAIQTRDGLIHVSYTYERTRIRHVVLDPAAWQ
jgi:predicted neuraminidase